MPRRKTREEFIEYSYKIHGDRYDYSLVEYKNNKTKVEIICKEHGVFKQNPNDHTGGHGCRKCSEIDQLNYNLKEAYSDKNKGFPLELYIIKIDRVDDSFLKVGLSKNCEQRFKNIKVKSRGDVSVIYRVPLTLQEGTIIEDRILQRLRKTYKKTFEYKFSGYTECLLIESEDHVIHEIKEFLSEEGRSDLVGKILDFEHKKY